MLLGRATRELPRTCRHGEAEAGEPSREGARAGAHRPRGREREDTVDPARRDLGRDVDPRAGGSRALGPRLLARNLTPAPRALPSCWRAPRAGPTRRATVRR